MWNIDSLFSPFNSRFCFSTSGCGGWGSVWRLQYILCSHSFSTFETSNFMSCCFLAYFPAEIRIRINGLPVLYGLATPLGWISTVSIGSLMVFCASFCSLLFLLCWCHPHIGDCAQPCLTSSSGPLVWKFTVNYFVLQRRGECIAIWVWFSVVTKYLRKTKCCVC